jgi:hypothetical protein
MTTGSWIGVGLSAMLLATAVITGGLALDASGTLQGTRYAASADAESQRTRVRALAGSTDALLAAAAVTLGTTLIVTFTRKPPAKGPGPRPVTGVGLSPAGLSLSGEF